MNPTVSVVLPVYNGEKYLASAVRSVLAQTYKVKEIILIDDGSKDGTPDVIKGFGDKVISRRIPNGGVANAMTLGVSMATGDFIAFLDHDDVWFRDKIRLQVEACQGHPEALFAVCNFAVRPVSLRRHMTRHYSRLASLKDFHYDQKVLKGTLKALLTENFVGTSSAVLAKTELIREVGKFDSHYKICGDYDFWLRCAVKTDFIVLNELCFYKRTHETNISADNIRTMLEHRDILQDFLVRERAYLREKELWTHCRREIAAVHYHIASLYLLEKQHGAVYGLIGQGLLSYPTPSNLMKAVIHAVRKSTRVVFPRRNV